MKIFGFPLPSWSKAAAAVATGGGVTYSANNGQVRVGEELPRTIVPVKPDKPPLTPAQIYSKVLSIDRMHREICDELDLNELIDRHRSIK